MSGTDHDFLQMLMDRAKQGVYEHHCNDNEHAKTLRQKLYNRRKFITDQFNAREDIVPQAECDAVHSLAGLTFKVDRNILILGPTVEMEKVWGHIPE